MAISPLSRVVRTKAKNSIFDSLMCLLGPHEFVEKFLLMNADVVFAAKDGQGTKKRREKK
jgi:hypothetical protein